MTLQIVILFDLVILEFSGDLVWCNLPKLEKNVKGAYHSIISIMEKLDTI